MVTKTLILWFHNGYKTLILWFHSGYKTLILWFHNGYKTLILRDFAVLFETLLVLLETLLVLFETLLFGLLKKLTLWVLLAGLFYTLLFKCYLANWGSSA